MSRDLQAPDFIGARIRQPHQNRADAILLQCLSGGPERLVFVRAHPQDALGIDAPSLQCCGAWLIRRRHEHHMSPCLLCKMTKRVGQQAHFTNATMFDQQLGHTTSRPASSGQCEIQGGIAARHHAQVRLGKLVALPHLSPQLRRQRSYCKLNRCCHRHAHSIGNSSPARFQANGDDELSLYIYTVFWAWC